MPFIHGGYTYPAEAVQTSELFPPAISPVPDVFNIIIRLSESLSKSLSHLLPYSNLSLIHFVFVFVFVYAPTCFQVPANLWATSPNSSSLNNLYVPIVRTARLCWGRNPDLDIFQEVNSKTLRVLIYVFTALSPKAALSSSF